MLVMTSMSWFNMTFEILIFALDIFVRMNKLLDEEIEEDELFWNQDALKEVFIHPLKYSLTITAHA